MGDQLDLRVNPTGIIVEIQITIKIINIRINNNWFVVVTASIVCFQVKATEVATTK